MDSWQVQEAKAWFSEFLDAAIKKGPQVVTRRGIEAAVRVLSRNETVFKTPRVPDSKICCWLLSVALRISFQSAAGCG